MYHGIEAAGQGRVVFVHSTGHLAVSEVEALLYLHGHPSLDNVREQLAHLPSDAVLLLNVQDDNTVRCMNVSRRLLQCEL